MGGPDNPRDEWRDDRENFRTNEVALDYNAGYTALLAAAIEIKGRLKGVTNPLIRTERNATDITTEAPANLT